jgi:arabinogalactan oligomer/maltooligosaccharide transport system substrate-binding protein
LWGIVTRGPDRLKNHFAKRGKLFKPVISTGKYELLTKGKYMFRNKKRVVGAALVAVLGLSGALTAVPAFAEEKVITVWADERRGPSLLRVLGTLAEQKGGEYATGYKIEVKPYASLDALKAAWDAATEITGPDIIVGPSDWIPSGVKDGKLAPYTMSASQKANFSSASLVDLSYLGKQYGAPLDLNNVAMIYNTKLVKSKPRSFGEMVNFYKANKTSKKLTNGLCVASGGMAFGGQIVLSALGGSAYQASNGKVNLTANPVNVSALSSNIKNLLLNANGKSNGFLPGTDAGCKERFLAGTVPFAVIGNWEWRDFANKGFNMSTLMPVPGVVAGTYGASFGSHSGAFLTSYAAKQGQAAGAKSVLTKFFASTEGQAAYAAIEQRPAANKTAAARSSSAAVKGFASTAALASIPQVGAILDGVAGSTSYWAASGAFWANVLIDGKSAATEATKLNKILKKNLAAGK